MERNVPGVWNALNLVSDSISNFLSDIVDFFQSDLSFTYLECYVQPCPHVYWVHIFNSLIVDLSESDSNIEIIVQSFTPKIYYSTVLDPCPQVDCIQLACPSSQQVLGWVWTRQESITSYVLLIGHGKLAFSILCYQIDTFISWLINTLSICVADS